MALERNDAQAAYDALDPDFRERVTFASFQERFDKQRTLRRQIEPAIRKAARDAAYIDASLTYSDFDTLQMALTPEGWLITDGLFNFYGQRSPREALLSFIKAMENRNYEALLNLAPAEYARRMDASSIAEHLDAAPQRIAEMLELLRQNRDNLIKSQGNRAWMAYGPYRMDFVREDGLWKIEDPD